MQYFAKAPLKREQALLFHPTLEETIPQDHEVRILDELLSLCDWSDWESEYHGSRGQPPIPPSVMARVILYGLIRGVRSSRKLEYLCGHNVDFMWLVEIRTIDHSTLCEFRKKFLSQLKSLFRRIGRIAMTAGLIRLGEVALDGTRARANNACSKTATAKTLEKRLAELDAQFDQMLQEADETDRRESQLFDSDDSPLPAKLADLKTRQEELQRALEQVQEADSARRRRGIDSDKKPAQIPMTDSDSKVLPNKEGGFAPNYTPMAATDGHRGFLVDSDVLSSEAEHEATIPTVDRIEETFGEKVGALLADGAFVTGPNIEKLVEREVDFVAPGKSRQPEPSNPACRDDPRQAVPEDQRSRLPRRGDGKLDASCFLYVAAEDCYYCPMGCPLKYDQTKKVDRSDGPAHMRVYRCGDCDGCPLRAECLSKTAQSRTIRHDQYRETRERHAQQMASDTRKEQLRRRSWIAETPFAVIKSIMGVRQFLLRGRELVRHEWLWIGTAFNLKKLVGAIQRMRTKFAALIEMGLDQDVPAAQ